MEYYTNDKQEEVEIEEQIPEKRPSMALKIGALILLIILLVVGIILPIKLVPNAVTSVSDRVSSWFSRSDKVILSTDKSPVSNGDQLTLSWTGNHRQDGTYILNYPCTEDARFETSIGQPYETIPCSRDYYFTPPSNSLSVIAYAKNKPLTDVPVTLSFLENGSASTTILADTLVVVSNQKATSTVAIATSTSQSSQAGTTTTTTSTTTKPVINKPSTPVQKPTPKPTKPVVTHRSSNPNGSSDLRIAITSTGIMNDAGQFIPAQSVPAGSRAAVKFIVTNVGDKNSGPWSFVASLPTQTRPTYQAINRPSIAPSDSISYVLGFDNINASTQNTVSITVYGDTITSNNSTQVVIPAY
jgi:hypothetical protein